MRRSWRARDVVWCKHYSSGEPKQNKLLHAPNRVFMKKPSSSTRSATFAGVCMDYPLVLNCSLYKPTTVYNHLPTNRIWPCTSVRMPILSRTFMQSSTFLRANAWMRGRSTCSNYAPAASSCNPSPSMVTRRKTVMQGAFPLVVRGPVHYSPGLH
jgi:hypothetical protein